MLVPAHLAKLLDLLDRTLLPLLSLPISDRWLTKKVTAGATAKCSVGTKTAGPNKPARGSRQRAPEEAGIVKIIMQRTVMIDRNFSLAGRVLNLAPADQESDSRDSNRRISSNWEGWSKLSSPGQFRDRISRAAGAGKTMQRTIMIDRNFFLAGQVLNPVSADPESDSRDSSGIVSGQ